MKTAQKDQDSLWEHFQLRRSDIFDLSYPRLRFFAQKCKTREIILNVGLGNGLLEKLLLQNRISLKTLDPSQKALRRAKRILGNKFEAWCGHLENIPYPEQSFDRVICTEVLEHLTPAQSRSGLREIWRILKPGGTLHGSVPFREKYKFHRWGHQQGGFEQTKMRSALENSGFQVVKCLPRTFVDFKRPGWRPFFRAVARRVLGSLGEEIVGPFLMFEAVKKRSKYC